MIVPYPYLKPHLKGFSGLVCLGLFFCIWLGTSSPCHPQNSGAASAKKSPPPSDLALKAREDLVRQLEKVQKDRTLLDQVRRLLEFLSEKPVMQASKPLATMGDDKRLGNIAWLLPHRTKLLTSTPTFCWEPVAGAHGYRLQLFQVVEGQGRLLWEETAFKSPFLFPKDHSPLKLGQQYAWRVWVQAFSAGGPAAKAEFWLPSEEEMKAVQTEAAALERKLRASLPEAKVLILLSGFYSQKGFHFKALQLLEQARRATPGDPLVKVALARVKEAMDVHERYH